MEKKFILFGTITLLLAACAGGTLEVAADTPVIPTPMTYVDPPEYTPTASTSPAVEIKATQLSDISSDPVIRSLRIVYSQDGNIWIADQGELRQLTDSGRDSSPRLTDDGNFVIFIRSRTILYETEWTDEYCKEMVYNDVMIVESNGSGEKTFLSGERLFSHVDIDDLVDNHLYCGIGYEGVEVVPGSYDLVFRTTSGGRYPSNYDLYLYDHETNRINSLISPGEGGNFQISPDGKWVAVGDLNGSFQLFSTAGNRDLRDVLSYQGSHDGPPYLYFPSIYWDPESSSVWVVAEAGGRDNLPFYTNEIWRVAVDWGEATLVDSILVYDEYDKTLPMLNGDLSSDFKRIAYPCKPTDSPKPGLCIKEIDSESSKFFDGEADSMRWLGWAPDGETFLYVLPGEILYQGSVNEPGTVIANLLASRRIMWVGDTDALIASYVEVPDVVYRLDLETGNVILIGDLVQVNDYFLLEEE